jgi:hypothetical protein
VGETDTTNEKSGRKHDVFIDVAGVSGDQRRTAGVTNGEIDDTFPSGSPGR